LIKLRNKSYFKGGENSLKKSKSVMYKILSEWMTFRKRMILEVKDLYIIIITNQVKG